MLPRKNVLSTSLILKRGVSSEQIEEKVNPREPMEFKFIQKAMPFTPSYVPNMYNPTVININLMQVSNNYSNVPYKTNKNLFSSATPKKTLKREPITDDNFFQISIDNVAF